MDLLPLELVIAISSSNPIAFARMIKADRRIYQYVCTPAGHNLFLLVCMEKRPTEFSVSTYSLITGNLHSFFGASAVVSAYGGQEWWQNGQWHRDEGPACICANGNHHWFQHNKLHRDNGPAVVRVNGSQYWYQNDKMHRLDGPAVVHANGNNEWWINGLKQDGSASTMGL